MINYIRDSFSIGDSISIYYGDREIRGVLEKIDDSFVIIRTHDENIVGIKIESISGFSKEPLYNRERGKRSENNYGAQRYSTRFGGTYSEIYQKKSSSYSIEPYKSEEDLRREKAIYLEISELNKVVIETIDSMDSSYPEVMETFVPAQGVIVELKEAFQFGFIDDHFDGFRYFFNKNDIIDNQLKSEEGEMIEVIYRRTRNNKGPAAKFIHKTGSIRELFDLIISHLEFGSYTDAYAILEGILETGVSNSAIDEIKELMEKVLEKAQTIGYEVKKRKNSLYSEARKRLQNKDYQSALDIYFECLELGIRKENCIKDILQIYVTTYAQKQSDDERKEVKKIALEFLEKNRDQLADAPSTNFTIENAYFALGEYDKHIEIAEEIVADCGKKGELAQYIFYLNKLAQSYYRIGEMDKALDAVHQGLDIEPQNQHLLKTLSTITGRRDLENNPFNISY